MQWFVLIISFATIIVNSLMILFLSTVGGSFRRSIRAFILSAVLANFWALGALLLMLFPLSGLGGGGRLLFLIAPMWVMFWLFMFADNYPGSISLPLRIRRAALIIVTIASLLTGLSSEYVIVASNMQPNGVYIPIVSLMPYIGYAAFFGLFSSLYSYAFWRKIQRSAHVRRKQIWFAYGGMLLSSFVAFLTNLFLPLIGIGDYIWAGPASSFIYALSYAFAMKRYRLFDVRRFALRAVVYVIALSVLVVIYAFVMGVVRRVIEQVLHTPISSDLFYTIMTVIAVFLYEPLKRLFDRYTKRVFFKNDYEIQDVIDQLGGRLLRANTRQDIADHAIKILRTTLLTDQVGVVMNDAHDARSHEFNEIFGSIRLNIVAVDNEQISLVLSTWMRTNEYELVASIKIQSRDIGWIVLGPKRSGNAYTEQDIALVGIASDEIAIAMESALQYEQIQEFNNTLQARVKDATDQLRGTNKKLRAIDASKDEFISMASHQLRTPLTSIKGYISMMLEGDLGDISPQQRKALEEAYNSSQRMVYLIGDFLNLSRLQTGRFELERADVSLPDIIAEEIAQLRATAQTRGVALQYESPVDFPLLSVEENKIRQVMMNFIDNAIYYARPEGGEITVSLVDHPHHVSFRVRDNGIGVPAHERPHLFAKFYRAANARKARPDGTGIGLYMAKKVILAHGGSIIFESKEGQGSEFGFRLPTKNPSA